MGIGRGGGSLCLLGSAAHQCKSALRCRGRTGRVDKRLLSRRRPLRPLSIKPDHSHACHLETEHRRTTRHIRVHVGNPLDRICIDRRLLFDDRACDRTPPLRRRTRGETGRNRDELTPAPSGGSRFLADEVWVTTARSKGPVPRLQRRLDRAKVAECVRAVELAHPEGLAAAGALRYKLSRLVRAAPLSDGHVLTIDLLLGVPVPGVWALSGADRGRSRSRCRCRCHGRSGRARLGHSVVVSIRMHAWVRILGPARQPKSPTPPTVRDNENRNAACTQ